MTTDSTDSTDSTGSTHSARTTATMRRLDDTHGAVRVEDLYATGIEDLWTACTTPERLARWFGEFAGDLSVGGTFTATFTSTWSGPGRVETCDAPHHLLVTLDPGGEEETQVEAWLTAEDEGTRLVVEERGLPLSHLHYYGSGWQAHLEDLGRSLLGEPPAWKARWDELTPAYAGMPVS